MYNSFFGLSDAPFTLTADPNFLFMTGQHREALAGLSYAILARKGIVMLTGEAGTGKTTLLSKVMGFLMAKLPVTNGVRSSLILNPTLTTNEFLEMVLVDFGISEIPDSKVQRILKLQQFLLDGHAAGKISVIVVDEAHKLSSEVLEEIRLLSNFEQADQKLVQIVLVGQNELAESLERQDLRQLKQRVGVRLVLKPLSTEVDQYIQYRWLKAGGKLPLPFDPEAIRGVAEGSRGIPRLINVICDNALLLAFGEEATRVTLCHVREVCGDFKLLETKVATAPASPAPVNGNSSEPRQAEEAAMAVTPLVRTLERYSSSKTKRSLWIRWVGKLGFVQ